MNRQLSPFKIFGIILLMPLVFLWQLLNQFLLSAWGLVVPMALLITLFAVQQIQKTPHQLAQFYAEQIETCEEAELPRLLKNLLQLGDAGIPGLVQGLASRRETVFTLCRNILQHELDRWQASDQREHHFLIFAEALLQKCDQFSPAAQVEAIRFVDQMMQIRPAASSPESIANRQQMIAHCERILARLESVRRRRIEPLHPEFAPQPDTVAALDQRTRQAVLLASNGQPFMPTSARQEEQNETLLAAGSGSYNPFSVPRADRLLAYQRSQQNNLANEQNNPRLSDDWATPVIARFAPPSAFTVEMERKFAQNFPENNSNSSSSNSNHSETSHIPNISEEYRHQKLNELESPFHSDSVLPPGLQNTPLDHVPNLPTTQLMQLLHHRESAYAETARRTLTSRDGFQEPHLKLAWRLYHPIPAVRQEIVAMLPSTPNIQPSVWLRVLLNDPSNDVRYHAASFLATANDPALRRLLIERGKRDTDPRIINLADRLNDSQGNIRR
jgi:hypothetical protein